MAQVPSRPPRCVHLSSVHPASDIRILRKECESLADAGFEVHLVAQASREAQTDARLSDRVEVHVLEPPRNRLERFTRSFAEVRTAALRLDADVYHFHDPELMPLGIELSLRGKCVVYDVHEDYRRQVMTKTWLPAGVRHAARAAIAGLEALTHRLVDAVVAATPDIARRFPGAKTTVVRNYPSLAEFPRPGDVPHAERPPQVAYVGTLYLSRGLRQMVEAVGRVAEARPARLVLGGTAADAATRAVLDDARGRPYVEHAGWLDRPAVSGMLDASRAGLVVLQPEDRFKTSYPVKMFEYMAAGLPVIASDFPLWRTILEREGAGLLVDPMDPRAIADAVAWVLDHPEEAEAMGRRGRRAVERQFNWSHEAETLTALYHRLLGTPRLPVAS